MFGRKRKFFEVDDTKKVDETLFNVDNISYVNYTNEEVTFKTISGDFEKIKCNYNNWRKIRKALRKYY